MRISVIVDRERQGSRLLAHSLERDREFRPVMRPAVLGVALGVHVCLLAALTIASTMQVASVDEPPVRVDFLTFAPPPPAPAPHGVPGGATAAIASRNANMETDEATENEAVQVAASEDESSTISDLVPSVESVIDAEAFDAASLVANVARADSAAGSSANAQSAKSAGEPYGEPHGQPGGVPGGAPGGVSGGLPGGTVGGHVGAPYRAGGDVAAPVALSRVTPIYPLTARQAHLEGYVQLEAVVRRDGTIGDVRVLHGLGLGCTEAAIQALRRWRFEPGQRQGVPVDVFFELTVDFRLNSTSN